MLSLNRRRGWLAGGYIEQVPPTLLSATVENVTPGRIDLVWSENMSATISAASAFAVSSGHSVTDHVRIDSTHTYLLVDADFVNAESKTLAYTTPASNKMKDLVGNLLADFSGAPIVNNVGENLYMYSDPSVPTFTTKYGYGNLSNNRADLRPTQKRIIIDGSSPTTINGNYYHVANWTTAKAAAADGDWILFTGGGSSSDTLNLSGLDGTSHQNMLVIGTYDPADAENDALFNTLMHTFDWTALAAGTVITTDTVACSDIAFVNQKFVATNQPTTASFLRKGTSYLLFENCIFDGVALSFNSFEIKQITGITSVGTTATATLKNVNTAMQTGDVVSITGCTGGTAANYNISASITVVDTTHFTYTIVDAGGVSASGSPVYNTEFNNYSATIDDITLRFCGMMYCGNSGGNSGNFFATGTNRVRLEQCVDFHGGYARGKTRATAGASNGPSDLRHGLYIDDLSDDTQILNCVTAWDASNAKLTGGRFQLQNYVAFRNPIAFLYDANTTNHQRKTYPNGSVFKCDSLLQVHTDDINTTDAIYRGWGPGIYQCAAGSYFKNGLLLNNDSPNASNRAGLVITSNGVGTTTVATIDGTVWGSFAPQSVSTTPDGSTTLTFTNNVWASATSGSNTALADKSAAYQAKVAAAQAKEVHTSLRLAYPEFFGTVAVGGTDLETEENMFEYMALHPMEPWCELIQTHYRSTLI